MKRAPSETPVKANSAEASNESDLDTPNLKRDESVKRNDARDKEVRKGIRKHTYKTCQNPHIMTALLETVSSL